MKKLIICLLAMGMVVPIIAKDNKGKQTSERTVPKENLSKGLFNVVQKNKDEWYMEISDSLIGKLILAVTRYTSTPTDSYIYGGELVTQQVVYWEVSPNDKLILRSQYIGNKADTLDQINKAVVVSNEDPIVGSFKIESRSNRCYRINVSRFFIEDNAAFSIGPRIKQQYGLTMLAPELSYIASIKTFPINTEVHTTKTFYSNGYRLPSGGLTGKVTFGLNTSFILLPKEPIQRRLFDRRVGYFADSFNQFSDHQQRVENKIFITRWRLEPKKEDLEKMKRGELVEPKKPIVFYIDPATPKKWRKYLIEGVNDWQKAFEHAGFKNAIYAKEWPENDSTMSMEDARFSVIRYLASPIENAYGPQIHDPRSGEILESHICWYHNVMKLVHDWYMIQAGCIDPRARKMQFDDDLMGELIRFVSSHEVGHALGLRHNFGASSTVPVEKLRDKEWLKKNGHTPSIMDYARFNYVAQPEDSVTTEGIYPRINDYDKWAIEWGYKPMFDAYDDVSDHWELNKLTHERLKNNRRLWFGDGETQWTDPRCQTEDLGDNAMKASEYGIKNLKRIIRVLPQWTYEANDINNRNLGAVYDQVYGQFMRYLNHVIFNIGGTFIDFKTVGQEGDIYSSVNKSIQQEALAFINKHVFNEPKWLVEESYISRIMPDPGRPTKDISDRIISSLIYRITFLFKQVDHPKATDYQASDYLNDLNKYIFKEISDNKPVVSYRRNLQKKFVDGLIGTLDTTVRDTDVQALVRSYLQKLMQRTHSASLTGKDEITRAHYASLAASIKKALKTE